MALLESRSAVLKYSSSDTASASPQVAEVMLRRQKFYLIPPSSLYDHDLKRIVDLSDGAELLVLDEFVMDSF